MLPVLKYYYYHYYLGFTVNSFTFFQLWNLTHIQQNAEDINVYHSELPHTTLLAPQISPLCLFPITQKIAIILTSKHMPTFLLGVYLGVKLLIIVYTYTLVNNPNLLFQFPKWLHQL